MKVCVIIPVFNEQDFIKKSVESLIDQTIKLAEVIYVNDNSTDNSKNIIKNLIGKCEWIRVIDHKSFQEHVPGSKVIEAFNFGLKNLETQNSESNIEENNVQQSSDTSDEKKDEDNGSGHQVIHKKDGRLHIYVRQDKYKGELKSKNWVGRLYIDGKQKISSS